MSCNLNGNFKYILIVSAVLGWVNSEFFETSENVILLNYCYKLVIHPVKMNSSFMQRFCDCMKESRIKLTFVIQCSNQAIMKCVVVSHLPVCAGILWSCLPFSGQACYSKANDFISQGAL